MLNKWLNPIPIVREYIAEKRAERRAVKKKSLNDKVKDLQNTNLNKVTDGRINYGYDEDGNLLAHSMSPYSRDFVSTLEPGIKDLVLALINKNYLTLSSCESHCLYSKRYVTLAFASNAQARLFRDFIRMEIPDIKFHFSKPVSYMNMELVFSEQGTFTGLKRVQVDEHEAVKSLNSLFCRSYNNYALLELQISEQINTDDTWLSSIKKKLYKVFRMKRVTKKLVELIKSDRIPVYIG